MTTVPAPDKAENQLLTMARQLWRSVSVPLVAVLLGILIGSLLLIASGANPLEAYAALLKGAFGTPVAFQRTLEKATPLIFSGLAVAFAFKAGLFNIGAQGQLLLGAVVAAFVGFSIDGLPAIIHVPLALLIGGLAGALYGFIPGALKAYTGAHEVIVTIMLNYVAYYLIAFLLRTPGALQAPGSTNPKSPAMLPTAVFPELFGPKYNLHLGFLFAIAATIWVWYLINRSNLGFQFRAVGENPNAARVAGMNVKNIYVYAMLISGGLINTDQHAFARGREKEIWRRFMAERHGTDASAWLYDAASARARARRIRPGRRRRSPPRRRERRRVSST